MSSNKPIIFIGPLTESLKRLKEDIEKIKESENLDIFEMEDINEVNQVLPTLGTSFTILNSPKKCAQLLQTNRNYIRNNKLKIILLSPKAIPNKIIQKLQKIGLTECITEPVPNKTLFYKAKIHIKAIKIFKKPALENERLNASDSNLGGLEEQEVKSKKIADVEFDDDLYGKKKEKKNNFIEVAKEAKEVKKEVEEEEKEDRTSGLLDELYSISDEIADEKSKLDEEFEKMTQNGNVEKSLTGLQGKVHSSDPVEGNLKGKSNFKEKNNSPMVGKSNFKEDNKSPMVGKSNYKEEDKSPMVGKTNFKENNKSDMSGKDNFKEKEQSNLSGKSNFQESPTSDMSGKSNFNEDPTSDMSGKSNYKEDEKSPMAGKDNFKEEQSSPLAGKSNFQEEDKSPLAGKTNFKEDSSSGMKGKLDSQDKIDGNMSGDQSKQADPSGKLAGKTNQNSSSEPGVLEGTLSNKKEPEANKKNESPLEKMKREKEEAERNQPKDVLEKNKEKDQEKKLDFDKPLLENDTQAKENEESKDSKKQLKTDQMNLEEETKKKKESIIADELKPKTEKEIKKEDLKSKLASVEENYDDKKDKPKTQKAWAKPKKTQKDQELSIAPEKEPLKKEEKRSDQVDFIPLDKKGQSSLENQKKNEENDLGYSLEDDKPSTEGSTTEHQEEVIKNAGNLKYQEKGDLGEQTIDYSKLEKGQEAITTDRDGEKGKSGVIDQTSQEKETIITTSTENSFKAKDKNKKTPSKDFSSAPAKEIDANPNGLDNLVDIFSFYFDKEKTRDDILNYISTHLNNLYNCKILVIQKLDKKDKEVIFHSGFEKDSVTDLISVNQKKWDKTGLPTWSDESFKSSNNSFLFPLYSGITPLGYAYIEFTEQVKKEHSLRIEVTLEGLRGIYLDIVDKMNGKVANKKKLNLNPFKKAS